MIEEIPGDLCAELQLEQEKGEDKNTEQLKTLHDIDQMLSDNQRKFGRKSLLYNIRSQLHFLQEKKLETLASEMMQIDSLRPGVAGLMELFGMKSYYPQKLKYEDVIKLTHDVHNDINKKPEEVCELPWYFVKHVIGLDSDARENCHVFFIEDDNDSDSDDGTILDIHPLDLIYIIFLCADDFLRQELADKMAKCQYAVPFILPPHQLEASRARYQILDWGLKSITRTYYHNEAIINKPLLDTEAPIVACLDIGAEVAWKL